MNNPQQPSNPPSPRARLQALLAVPDRDRTDAEWDELNELEILFAPGNREGSTMPTSRRSGTGPMQSGRREAPGIRPPGGNPQHPQGKRQGKKFHRGPRKPNQQRQNPGPGQNQG